MKQEYNIMTNANRFVNRNEIDMNSKNDISSQILIKNTITAVARVIIITLIKRLVLIRKIILFVTTITMMILMLKITSYVLI